MQSKTSFFNKTLFRKNLMRFWPLWGMASFLWSLPPMALLMELIRNRHADLGTEYFSELYYSVVSGALPIISLLYAVLCAMVVWNYLYNTRSVGMMHTLPIRREGVFLTGFLSGMAMMLIPYVISGTLCGLISLASGAFDGKGMLITILCVLGESFFYFSSATFVAFITGNIFAMPAIYCLLHFLAVLLDWLVSTLARGFIFGMDSDYSGMVECMSPTVYLLNHIGVDREYTEMMVQEAGEAPWYRHVLSDITLTGQWVIGVYVLAGVVLLGLAWILYRRRRSETAGDVVAVGWLRPVFRYGMAALCALLGGLALYAVFWSGFQSGQYYHALPMAVCMMVAGGMGYFAASMLLSKSLRVFRSGWKGLALILAGCGVLCALFHMDPANIAGRVPESQEVEQMKLSVDGNEYILYPGETDELLEQVRGLHKAIVAERDDLMTDDIYAAEGVANVSFSYQLKNGRTVNRWYWRLPMKPADIQQEGTYANLLDSLVSQEVMEAIRLHTDDTHYTLTGGYIYTDRGGHIDLSDRESEKIVEAVRRDAAAGSYYAYDWFDEKRGQDYSIDLQIFFTRRDNLDKNRYYYGEIGVEIVLDPEMRETIDCLLQMGVLTEQDLVTRAQMYPEEYGLDPVNVTGADTGEATETTIYGTTMTSTAVLG